MRFLTLCMLLFILAEEGDAIIVELTNDLVTENAAIHRHGIRQPGTYLYHGHYGMQREAGLCGSIRHWHGIRQIGTPWFDGTEGVTQCPILPGETFTYEYKVDRPGTYLYHGHYGMQREAGLYGSIRHWHGIRQPGTYLYHAHYGMQREAGLYGSIRHWHGIRQPGTYLYHAHYGMQREARLYGSIRVSVARGKTEPFSYEYDLNGVSTATLPYTILSLLSLIIPALIALVALKSKNDTLTVFEARPTTIKVTVASLLAFVVACGIDLGFHTYHSPSWAALLRTIIVFSALLSVASLSSLLFPDALVSAGRGCERVGQRFMEKLHNLFTRIQQYQMRRNPPDLPLTNMDAVSS